MGTSSQARWHVLAFAVALFAALALTACSDEPDNDSNQTTTDETLIKESASLKVTEGTGGASTADTTTIEDSASIDVASGGSGSATTDSATITESAVAIIQSSPQPGGGGTDRALLRDSVSFVVRDSSGVVKDQGILN